MKISAVKKSGLLTLTFDTALHIPPWPKMNGMSEAAIIKEFGIEEYLVIEVVPSSKGQAGEPLIEVLDYHLVQFDSN